VTSSFPSHNRGEPPFEILDGRSERTRAIDAEVRVWQLSHPVPEIKRPSELARKRGVHIGKKYGLTVCTSRGKKTSPHPGRGPTRRDSARTTAPTCGYLIPFEMGQRTAKCGRCGRRIWLAGHPWRNGPTYPILYTHDDPEVIGRIIAGIRGWWGRGKFFIPTWLFPKWAERAERKRGVEFFYSLLPWNIRGAR